MDTKQWRQVLAALRETVHGQRRTEGRDTVPMGYQCEIGGMRGRALDLTLAEARAPGGARRFTLRSPRGALVAAIAQEGEYLVPYGDLEIEVESRAAGAAFLDDVALWLGTPIAEPASISAAEAPAVITGRYAKLGERNDADGVCWEVFKLMLGEHVGHAEVFLRVASGAGRAAFVEKWSAYRAPLLRGLDRLLGLGRAPAPRKPVSVSGGVWLTVPPDWAAAPVSNHVRLTDAADDILLEVSHQPFPLAPGVPGVAERLALVLEQSGHGGAIPRIAVIDRGDAELAWVDFEMESEDDKRGGRRMARARWSVMANDALHSLATYYYWPEDGPRAVPEWERIVSTMRLGTCPDRGDAAPPRISN